MKKIKYHIIFWVLFFLYAYLSDFYLYQEVFFWDELVLTITHPVLVFYLSLSFLRRFSVKDLKSTGKSLLFFVLTILIFGGVKYLYRAYFLSIFNFPPYTGIKWEKFIADGAIWYIHFFIWALGYHYATGFSKKEKALLIEKQEKNKLVLQTIELEKKNLELQSQNLQLQNEKLKVQYDFLKAQINPHFLYNTLSFFYSKTAAIDIQTAEGIALLTDIMRYSLQQGEADGKVELEDEVAHLNSYIRLQQMRFNNTLNIDFDNDIETEEYRILPHVFITLVENAFKHGEVNNPMHPLKISLKEADNRMVFLVKNKIQYNPVINPGTGVGLNNIRNRLKMEYGDTALLENSTVDEFFTVSFSVPLALLEKKRDVQVTRNDARPVSLINKKTAL